MFGEDDERSMTASQYEDEFGVDVPLEDDYDNDDSEDSVEDNTQDSNAKPAVRDAVDEEQKSTVVEKEMKIPDVFGQSSGFSHSSTTSSPSVSATTTSSVENKSEKVETNTATVSFPVHSSVFSDNGSGNTSSSNAGYDTSASEVYKLYKVMLTDTVLGSDAPKTYKELAQYVMKKFDKPLSDVMQKLSGLNQQSASYKSAIADYEQKKKSALQVNDHSLASSYDKQKAQYELKLTQLLSDAQHCNEQINQIKMVQQVYTLSTLSDFLYNSVSALTANSYDFNFEETLEQINGLSKFCNKLLSQVNKKSILVEKSIQMASDDLAKQRFNDLLTYYRLLNDSLSKSSARLIKTKNVYDLKYGEYSSRIAQGKQLHKNLDAIRSSSPELLYALFTNLSTQVSTLSSQVDALSQKIASHDKDYEEMKGKVSSFSDELNSLTQKGITVEVSDKQVDSMAQNVSRNLSEGVVKQFKSLGDSFTSSAFDSINSNVTDIVKTSLEKELNSTIKDLKESSDAFNKVMTNTEQLDKASKFIDSLSAQQDTLAKQMIDNSNKQLEALEKNITERFSQIASKQLDNLRKELYASGKLVFTAFAQSYGLVGKRTPLATYFSSPVGKTHFVILLLTIFMFGMVLVSYRSLSDVASPINEILKILKPGTGA